MQRARPEPRVAPSEIERDLGRKLVTGADGQCRATVEGAIDSCRAAGRAEVVAIEREARNSDFDVVQFLLESVEVGHCGHGGEPSAGSYGHW